ncbi:MAG: FG-GAP repeat protein [Myxococcales bacterium]|nr:FG-GAP repeat protein [Myxococcales bacterium]
MSTPRLHARLVVPALTFAAALAGCLTADDGGPLEDDPPAVAPPADDAEAAGAHWGETGTCSEERCAGRVPTAPDDLYALARTGKRGRGSNSQLALAHNVTLADVNADGISDLVQVASNRIFVSKADAAKTGILHTFLRRPIKRLITGDFHGDRSDQVCAIQDDNALVCWGISTDRKELWWWFSQGSFVGDGEDFVVADFDGDGRDDVLVYPRGAGAYRMYSIKTDYFFAPTPAFNQGDLGFASAGNLQLRAGDIDGDGRDDLVVSSSSGREVAGYASRWNGVSQTFVRTLVTRTGFVGLFDQVSVARVNNDLADDLALHNPFTGATRFYRMQLSGTGLLPISDVPSGQISTTYGGILYWGALHAVTSELGSSYRDDALVWESGWNGLVRSDARWDGTRLTYWWAYTAPMPANDTGWAPLTSKRGLVLRCKFSDVDAEPLSAQALRGLVLGAGGLANYWFETSYGAFDMSDTEIIDVARTMALPSTNAGNRAVVGNACIAAHGLTATAPAYPFVITFVNADSDSSAWARLVVGNTAAFTQSSTYLAHEVAHALGWATHSHDDTLRTMPDAGPGEYRDSWDIMSAMLVRSFTTPLGYMAGPEMNAPQRTIGNFIPAQRVVRLTPAAAIQTARVSVAAINRPEANGALMVRIGADDNNYYAIEYRTATGFDRGFARDTVLVHRYSERTSYLITTAGAERLPGSSMTVMVGGRAVTIRVNSFAADGATADVSVDY